MITFFLYAISETVPVDPSHSPFSVQTFLASIALAYIIENNFGSRPPMSSDANLAAARLLSLAIT